MERAVGARKPSRQMYLKYHLESKGSLNLRGSLQALNSKNKNKNKNKLGIQIVIFLEYQSLTMTYNFRKVSCVCSVT